MKLKSLAVLLAALTAFLVPATSAHALSSKEIQKELMCQCGCTMIVDACDCDTANQIRDKIAGLLDRDQGKNEIIAYFVSQYGEKMLAAPTKKGFNLVAWILPFAAVIVGGAALFFILRAWVLKGRHPTGEMEFLEPVSAEEAGEYRGRLEEELKLYREEHSE